MRPTALTARAIEFLRYSAVGLICFVVATGTLAVLHEAGRVAYMPAYICAFLISLVLGYLLHGHFTFADGGPQTASLPRYLLVTLTLLFLNSVLFSVLVDFCHLWYIAASCLLAGVNIPVSFVAHRRLSYGLAPPTAVVPDR